MGTYELHYAIWEEGEWSAPKNIVILPSGPGSIDLVVDRWNVLHIIWEDVVVDQWEVYYIRWNGTAWSVISGLSHNWGYSFDPAMALDSNDILHAVWTDTEPFFPSNGIVYCSQPADDPLPPYRPTATNTLPPTDTPTVTPTPSATPTSTPTATPTPTIPPTATPSATPTPEHHIFLPILLL